MRMHLRRKGFCEHQIDSKNCEGKKMMNMHMFGPCNMYVCRGDRERETQTKRERWGERNYVFLL